MQVQVGLRLSGNKLIIGRVSGSQIYVDFYDKDTYAYQSTKALSGLTETGNHLMTRLASVGNYLYVFSRRETGGTTKHYLDELMKMEIMVLRDIIGIGLDYLEALVRIIWEFPVTEPDF